ncbi:hypothetical protein ANCDUO_12972 [Ancylostoma duodenale]|uniref:Uncharacterized protein n=1 Tax=Ancylostoma duodenale TaxID=51022 RepID=A0A0C2GDA2_9BILA|nr:hypothetical protein ANCDUO_12972 [Ancylostoma duodenale]
MHGYQGHQTLLAALTASGKERTNAFGRMGLAFGLGFVIAPTFSMIATTAFGESAPIIVSAALCNPLEIGEESNNNANVANVIRILQRPGVLNV